MATRETRPAVYSAWFLYSDMGLTDALSPTSLPSFPWNALYAKRITITVVIIIDTIKCALDWTSTIWDLQRHSITSTASTSVHANQNGVGCSGTPAVVILLESGILTADNTPHRWNGAIAAIVVSPPPLDPGTSRELEIQCCSGTPAIAIFLEWRPQAF
jgi:hypothetical protein